MEQRYLLKSSYVILYVVLYLTPSPYSGFINFSQNALYSSFFLGPGFNPGYLLYSSNHLSLVSFNREKFFSFSLCFLTLTFLKVQVSYLVEFPSLWVCLSFDSSYDIMARITLTWCWILHASYQETLDGLVLLVFSCIGDVNFDSLLFHLSSSSMASSEVTSAYSVRAS